MAKIVSGKISQILVEDKLARFKLDGLPNTSTPKGGDFEIRKSEQNYNALYSLALSAAINRYTLVVKTAEEITSKATAKVKELWVDW